jgi:low affinity Fe/Cu permease
VAVVLAWVVTGPIFHFSDTWQLVINTATTVVTFLMVFLIQNTQNRDTEAIQIKLDELIRATKGAHNALLDLEELEEETLDQFRTRYEALALKARRGVGGVSRMSGLQKWRRSVNGLTCACRRPSTSPSKVDTQT